MRGFFRWVGVLFLLMIGSLDLCATFLLYDIPIILFHFLREYWASSLLLPLFFVCLDVYSTTLMTNKIFLFILTFIKNFGHVQIYLSFLKKKSSLQSLLPKGLIILFFFLSFLKVPEISTLMTVFLLLTVECLIVLSGTYILYLEFFKNTAESEDSRDHVCYIDLAHYLENIDCRRALTAALFLSRPIMQTILYLQSKKLIVLYYLELFWCESSMPEPAKSLQYNIVSSATHRLIQFTIFFRDLMTSQPCFELWRESSRTLLFFIFRTLHWYPFGAPLRIVQAEELTHCTTWHAVQAEEEDNTPIATAIIFTHSAVEVHSTHHLSVS